LLAKSGWRAVSTICKDYRLGTLAHRTAVPLAAGAFEVRGFSGVSLAGILRPTILVGSEAVAALTPGELEAAIAHERAHWGARDNFKRFLMFCAPDLFGWSAAARHLEERWRAEAECAADARAARGDDRRALLLASALVKVARLARHSGCVVPSPAWSAFHLAGLLETRVRRLTAGRAPIDTAGSGLWWRVLAGAIAVSVTVWLSGGSYLLHQATESLVTHLP
jgi:beta-lactamase regulating signal transducer with metallopeptidase domain